MMIGNKYISDHGITDSLPSVDDVVYLSLYFEKSFLSREDILYLPCMIRSYNYHFYLSDYYNFSNFKLIHEKFKAEMRSLYACKIPITKFIDFLSYDIIFEFYSAFKEAILFLFDKYNNVPDYEYLAKAFIVSEYIGNSRLLFHNEQVKILFNPFTDYGRYGLNAGSFNILSLSKDKRGGLLPLKDYEFVEFDYNAFEVRVLLSMLKINQPAGDLYEVLHNMSDDYRPRSQFKQFLISSLYSKNEDKTVLYKFIKSKRFYERFKIENGFVTNVFGKKMDSDEYHLMSRILQSSAAYILYQQMFELLLYLQTNNLKSKLSFSIHDSICISVHYSEKDKIPEFRKILSDVRVKELNYQGTFEMKTKIGKNYGDMKLYET